MFSKFNIQKNKYWTSDCDLFIQQFPIELSLHIIEFVSFNKLSNFVYLDPIDRSPAKGVTA
jgi:hypothetical protein